MTAAPGKHSVFLNGKRTSVSLEPEFYEQVRRIASARNLNISQFVASVADGRDITNLSSELRLAVLRDLRARAFPPAPATAPEMEAEATQ